jgi:PAS domain S-box-containing protein
MKGNTRFGNSDSAEPLTQEHLSTILSASHDVLFVLDGEDKTILHVNATVERVLGYSCDSLLGNPFSALVQENAPDHLQQCRFFDGVFGPVAFLCNDGNTCQADVTAAVIPWGGEPSLLYNLRDVTERTALEEDREGLLHDLQQALATVKRLSGLLPICANCKRIRDDEGYWETVEEYIGSYAGVHFSHSICPTCREEQFPDLPHVPLDEKSLGSVGESAEEKGNAEK